jgi:serine/threonine protein kinase
MILQGGKKISEGYKGVTMDVYDTNYIITRANEYEKAEGNLYEYMRLNKPSEIILYGLHKNIKIRDNYEEILKHIEGKSNYIVKKFKRGNIFIGNDKHNFKNELRSVKKLDTIYKDKLSYYTSIKPIFTYSNVDIYAISFSHRFYIFQEKCHQTVDNVKFTQKEFNKFVKDIYESLLILQKSNFIHNDIKADNVIYCDNRYKLIDWDLADSYYTRFKSFVKGSGGNFIFNHPIKFYSLGLPIFIFRTFYNIFKSKDNDIYKWIFKLKSYKIIEKKSLESTSLLIDNNIKLKSLIKHYDMYSFALLIIFLAEKNKLKYSKIFVNQLLKPFLISI